MMMVPKTSPLLGLGLLLTRRGLASRAQPKPHPSLAIIDDYLNTSAPHFSKMPSSQLQITTFNDTTTSGGSHLFQGVQHPGVVVAVCGQLDKHHVRQPKPFSVGECLAHCRFLRRLGIFRKRKRKRKRVLVGFDDVDMAIPRPFWKSRLE
ncbi:hypothetical protein QQX98_001284 [Neonectria punicea]|uniref:Secreted protein n=1 Tax=Neonectria punicea TaxID=979145 RepID=A0ABR1HPA4_9HYPO